MIDWIVDAAPALAVAIAFGAATLSYLSLRLSRRALEAANRPVIVSPSDAGPDSTIMLEGIPAGKPLLDFEIRNVGMGPALNVRGQCAALLGGVAWAIGQTPHPVNVAAGADATIRFIADENDQMLNLHSELVARFAYEDVAGARSAAAECRRSFACWRAVPHRSTSCRAVSPAERARLDRL